MTPSQRPPKVVAVFPSLMSARQLLLTRAGPALAASAEATCLLQPGVAERIGPALDRLSVKLLTVPSPDRRFLRRLGAAGQRLWPGAGFGGLSYRFNEIQGFAGHQFKKSFQGEAAKREAIAGNYVAHAYGRPFPRWRTLYDVMSRLYWTDCLADQKMRRLISDLAPDVIYIGQVPSPIVRDAILAARRLGVPIVGNVLSWDHPNLKGPVPPGLDRYTVQNQWMADMLIRHHGVPSERIVVTGWPQMDGYMAAPDPSREAAARARYDVAPDAKVILFGLNPPRLGSHEPEAVRRLLAWMDRPECSDVHLLLRPHPRYLDALADYDFIAGAPRVTLVTDGLDDVELLHDQLLISSVVLCSVGSLALDATATKRPAIWLHRAKVVNLELMEHLAAVAATNAIPVATNLDSLIEELEVTLGNPNRRADERATLIEHYLAPLDGHAGERLVGTIVESAKAVVGTADRLIRSAA